MVHAGLDLSRRKLDVVLLSNAGEHLEHIVVAPDAEGLRHLAEHVASDHGGPVRAVIESMTGARFVHDRLELHGWEVLVADAKKAKGIAPLACKTDIIDAGVLAELSWRDFVPEIWLPGSGVRAERERARFRLRLVHQRSMLKSRIHQTLISFGHPCPVSDLFGAAGRDQLSRMALPEPWNRDVTVCLGLIDHLDTEIDAVASELAALAPAHPYVPLLQTIPGIGLILASTIAAEIGDISRFSSPSKLIGYAGLCPRVYQSGGSDRRGPLAKTGPKHLRWALIEASWGAMRTPPYFRDRAARIARRLGRQRGNKVAAVDIARKLCEAIWFVLSRQQPFQALPGASRVMAA